MLCELLTIEITCEDCGRAKSLGFPELSRATFKGVYSYRMLCERLSCSQCPPMPRRRRRLNVNPVWRDAATA